MNSEEQDPRRLSERDLVSSDTDIYDDIQNIVCEFAEDSHQRVVLGDHGRDSSQSECSDACFHRLDTGYVIDKTALAQIRKMLKSGRLYDAHKYFLRLEKVRDDGKYELHKNNLLGIKVDDDENMEFSEDMEEILKEINDAVWSSLNNFVLRIDSNESQFHAAIRILLAEEQIDSEWQIIKEKHGFMPELRPRKWRENFQKFLRGVIVNQVKDLSVDNRIDNEAWLVKHLDLLRDQTVDNLKLFKRFLEELDLFHYCVLVYHDTISNHLTELTKNEDLTIKEIVSLLIWTKAYTGSQMLGLPELEIDTSDLDPVLSADVVEKLTEKYLSDVIVNLNTWMVNCLLTDVRNWELDAKPDVDEKGLYTTPIHMFIYELTEQNLVIAKCVEDDFADKLLSAYLDSLEPFCTRFKAELEGYRELHLIDRDIPPYYLEFLMACVNNCERLLGINQYLIQRFSKSGWTWCQWEQTFITVAKLACQYICDEVIMDLKDVHDELFTRTWLEFDSVIDTVCLTVKDYVKDFIFVKPGFYILLLCMLRKRLLHEYLTAFFARKLIIESREEGRKVATLMSDHAVQFNSLFLHFGAHKDICNFDCIADMAEVVDQEDISSLSIDICALYTKHPDLSREHLRRILAYRGDMTVNHISHVALENIPNETSDDTTGGVFPKLN